MNKFDKFTAFVFATVSMFFLDITGAFVIANLLGSNWLLTSAISFLYGIIVGLISIAIYHRTFLFLSK